MATSSLILSLESVGVLQSAPSPLSQSLQRTACFEVQDEPVDTLRIFEHLLLDSTRSFLDASVVEITAHKGLHFLGESNLLEVFAFTD